MSGRLDRRIVIQAREDSGTARGGGRNGNWVEVTACWARIEPLRSFAANVEQLNGGTFRPVRIHIRKSSQINKIGDGDARWRALDTRREGVVFDIVSVQNLDERGLLMTLTAVERVST